MIDVESIKQKYDKYINQYDMTNPRIALKAAHIYRTAEVAKELAQSLGLDIINVDLAYIIGLFHDIGRFEQLKRYNTFDDSKSINHGECGADILFKEGFIREFIKDSKYDKIIKKSIINHNKDVKKIIDIIDNDELLHTKIIRDADKIDIYKVLLEEDIDTLYEKEDISNDVITDEIYQEVINNKTITYKNIKTPLDILVSQLIYIYDINFPYSLTIINENKYIDKLYNRIKVTDIKVQERLENVYNQVKEYMNTKLKNLENK